MRALQNINRERPDIAGEVAGVGVGPRQAIGSETWDSIVCEENSILAAARAYQSLTDWHRPHPSVD